MIEPVVEAATERLIERACAAKVRHAGRRAARRAADDARARGVRVSPYRCPFCGGWHVGHPPSLVGMQALARAIRDRAGNRPGAAA